MPTRWDAQGNVIPDAPPPTPQRWDANGNPVGGAFKPALEPTAKQLDVTDPTSLSYRQSHAKGIRPEIQKWASENPQASEEARQGIERGPMNALANLTGSIVDAGKEVLLPHGDTEWAKWKDIYDKLIYQPVLAEKKKAGETTGLESAGHSLASVVPVLGPMASQAGSALGRKDYGGAAVVGGAALLGARGAGELDEGLKGKVSEASKSIQRHLAIDQGKVRVVNDMVRKPLAMLDNAVSTEVGKSVNRVVDADEMDMKGKGVTGGMVDVSKAAGKAREAVGMTAKELSNQGESQIIRGETDPMMTMRDAKSYTTDVGRMASAARRAGNFREAAGLDALYDGLHDATAARAKDLGQSKIWQHYIDETRTYKQMQSGLLGELVDEPVHSKALGKLIDPARATEASEISKALDKYGIDPSTFDKAKELGSDLNRYSQETKANFMGKIKAIIKHPYTAGPAAVGASMAGTATGLPGMGLVLPIIVAGKVANMLDAADLKSLLKEIQQATPPEAGQVRPPLEGPMKGGSEPPAPSGDVPRGTLPKAPDFTGDIQSTLQDQFHFTKGAAKNVTDSIAGKYSTLDEGLKMALAEAVKRTKSGKGAPAEDTMEAARRGAAGRSPIAKSIEKHYKKERE